MDLVRYATRRGTILIESHEIGRGFQDAGAADKIAEATKTFEAVLSDVADAADIALATLWNGPLRPGGIELEFGVKFSAEHGAVIAKAAIEGSMTVKLIWGSGGPAVTGSDNVGAAR